MPLTISGYLIVGDYWDRLEGTHMGQQLQGQLLEREEAPKVALRSTARCKSTDMHVV